MIRDRVRLYGVLLACFGFVAVANAAVGYQSGDWTLAGVALTAAGGAVTFLCGLAGAVMPARFDDGIPALGLALTGLGVLAFTVGTAWMVL